MRVQEQCRNGDVRCKEVTTTFIVTILYSCGNEMLMERIAVLAIRFYLSKQSLFAINLTKRVVKNFLKKVRSANFYFHENDEIFGVKLCEMETF